MVFMNCEKPLFFLPTAARGLMSSAALFGGLIVPEVCVFGGLGGVARSPTEKLCDCRSGGGLNEEPMVPELV